MNTRTNDTILEDMQLKDYKRDNTIYVKDLDSIDVQIKICRQLRKLGEKELKKIEKDRQPIKMRISSFGGLLISCFAIVSEMKRLQDMGIVIETYCDGFAISAGAIILMCGTKGYRYTSRYSQILVHQIQCGNSFRETHKELRERAKTTDNQWEILKGIIVDNTKITEAEAENYVTSNIDYTYSSLEAKDKGIIDIIL